MRKIMVVGLVCALAFVGCSSEGSDGVAPLRSTTSIATDVTGRPIAGSAGCGSTAIAGETEETMESGATERRFFQAIPPGYEAEVPMPVVLDFHGYGEGAELHLKMSNLGALGAAEGFIVITPQGLGEPPQWATELDSADLVFVGDLLDEVEVSLCVDLDRVYSTGYSNGARLTSAIACAYGDRVAAVSTVAGVRTIDGCAFTRPVPMVSFHGTADDVVPYEGGLGEGNLDAPAPDGSDRTWRESLTDEEIRELDAAERPTVEIVAAWAERNGCTTDATEESETADVTRITWDCPEAGATELHRITEGGHTWPGSALSSDLEGVLGPTTMTIDANEIMWAFFEDHPLPAAG